jgi:two-component system, NtrC family, response regulator HydG
MDRSPKEPEERILLVEDEATIREVLTYTLRSDGYTVDTVGSAGAAAICLQSIPYALVISDWFLPDGNGVDIADAAANLGSRTLIISDFLFQLPTGKPRHELLSKRLGPEAIVEAIKQAIGSPMGEVKNKKADAEVW